VYVVEFEILTAVTMKSTRLRLWWWRQSVLLERWWISTELNDIISQKIELLRCTLSPDCKVVYDNPRIPVKWNIYFWYKFLSKRQMYQVNGGGGVAPCSTCQSVVVAQLLYVQISLVLIYSENSRDTALRSHTLHSWERLHTLGCTDRGKTCSVHVSFACVSSSSSC
jgi:hypothetical protein